MGVCVSLSLSEMVEQPPEKLSRKHKISWPFPSSSEAKGVSVAVRQAGAQSDNPRRRGHLTSHWEPGLSQVS